MGQMYSSPGQNLKDRAPVQNYYGQQQMAENMENSDLATILRNVNLRNIVQNSNQPAPSNFHEPLSARSAVQSHQEASNRNFDQNSFQQLFGAKMEPVLQTLKAQGVGSVTQNQLYELFNQISSQQGQQMSARSSPQNYNARQFHSSVSPSNSSRPPSNSNANNYQRLYQQQQQQQQQQQDVSLLQQMTMNRHANTTLSPVPKRPRVMGPGNPENQASLNSFYLLQRHLDQTTKQQQQQQPLKPQQPQQQLQLTQPQKTVQPRHTYMSQHQPSVLHPHPHHQFLAHQVHASQLRADDHSLSAAAYPSGSISHSSVTPHGSGVLKQQTKEPAYHPQVEAISPAPEDTRMADTYDLRLQLQNERARISAKLKTLSEDISKQEVFHRSLTERELKLANSLKMSNTIANSETVRIPNGTRVSSHTGIPIKSIIEQNKDRARQQHRILAKFCGKWVKADSLSLPLYRQPADLLDLHQIEQRFQNGFKQKLINHLRRRQNASNARLKMLSNRYSFVYKFYRKKVERLCNSAKRKQKDGKHREIFEKIFPEIKKSRDERIPSSDDTRNEEFRLSSSAGGGEDGSSTLYDPVAEVVKMKEYAIDPPVLLAPWERKYEFVCKSGLVHDARGQHSASQDLSSWTDEEKAIFKERYMATPKNFSSIASYLERKSVADCILYYYKSKRKECYKSLVKKNARKRRAAQNERNAAAPATATASTVSSLESTSIEPIGQEDTKEEEVVTAVEKRGKIKVAPKQVKTDESDEVKPKTPKPEPSVATPVKTETTTVSSPSSNSVPNKINDLIHISIDKNIMTSQAQQQRAQQPEPVVAHQFALSAQSLLQQKQSAPNSTGGPSSRPVICPVTPPPEHSHPVPSAARQANEGNFFNPYSQPSRDNYGGAAAANSRLDLLSEKLSSVQQKSQHNKANQAQPSLSTADILLNAIGPENIRSGNIPMDQLSHILAKLINAEQPPGEHFRRAQPQQQPVNVANLPRQESNLQMYNSAQQRLAQAPPISQQQRLLSSLQTQKQIPVEFGLREHPAQPTSTTILLENFLTAQQLGGRQAQPPPQKIPFDSGQPSSSFDSQFYQPKQQQQPPPPQQFRPANKQTNEAQLIMELFNALNEHKNPHHLATLLASVVASGGTNIPVISSMLNALNPSSSKQQQQQQVPESSSTKNPINYSPLSPSSSPQEDRTRSLSKDLRSFLSQQAAPMTMYSSVRPSMEEQPKKTFVNVEDEEMDGESSIVSTLTATTVPGQKMDKTNPDEDQDLLEDLQPDTYKMSSTSTDHGLFPPPAAVNYSTDNTNYIYRKRGYTDSQVSLRCQVAGRNRESKKAKSPDTLIGQGEPTTSFANVNLMSSSVLPSDQVSMETASACSPSAMEKEDLKIVTEETLLPAPPPPPSDIVEDLIKSQLSKNVDEPPHVALTSVTLVATANPLMQASSKTPDGKSASSNQTVIGQMQTLSDHINKAIQDSMRPSSEDPPFREMSPHHPMQTSPISPGSEVNQPREEDISSDEASSYNLKIDLYPEEKAPSPYRADDLEQQTKETTKSDSQF